MRWGMLRGAGVRVDATTPVADVGRGGHRAGWARSARRAGWSTSLDEPDRRGFAYGTLPGHAEIG